MQKAKYKNQVPQKNKIAIMITVAVAILFVLLILMAIFNQISSRKQEKEEAIRAGEFNSVEDVLTYYGCKLIQIQTANDEEFEMIINCQFSQDLYNGEESNEKFYSNLIQAMAKFLNYTNFKMIDQSKEEKIEIAVIGEGSRIKKVMINGIEDYFIYMDSQNNLKKYKEFKTTELSIESQELKDCIANNWSTNTNFGTRETIFQDYYIYFDEGIRTRKISGKIYNIVFTNHYTESVVNGFTVGQNYDIIKRELGTPTFQNTDGSIIGYKSNEIYIFFEKNQISVYRNTQEEGFDDFFKLVDEFLNDKYTLLEFMNELTYLWPDYEEYTYDTDTIFLSYPNKGIDIKMNYDNINGIVLYNNIGVNQGKVNQYLKSTEFIARLQIDNVFQAEERRTQKEANLEKLCKEYREGKEAEDDRNRGEMYHYYMQLSKDSAIMGIYFLSQNEQYPNCELSENVKSYIWLNDYCFLYSVENKGIYYYDLKNQIRGVIITGEESFEIQSYQDGILKYDDSELEVRY